MRVIKFRAWHPTKGMFSPETMGSDQLTLMPDGKGFVNVSGSDTKHSELMTHMIPMQFTGLKDERSMDIYEGDILRCDWANEAFPPFAAVVWDEDEGYWGYKKYEQTSHGLEVETGQLSYLLAEYNLSTVNGNIYESPELLESQ